MPSNVISGSGGGGAGDVTGPASATDNAIARYNTTTGKLIQDSGIIIADTTDNISGMGSITPKSNETADYGTLSNHSNLVRTKTLYIDSAGVNYGKIEAGAAGGVGGALLINHAVSHIGIVTNGGGGVYFSTAGLYPETASATVLGSAARSFSALYLDNTATDGGAIYFNAGTSSFLKSSADGATLSLDGFAMYDLTGASLNMNAGGVIYGGGENQLASWGSLTMGNYPAKTYSLIQNTNKPIFIDAAQMVKRTDASLAAAILTANEVRTDFIAHFANATRHTAGQQSTAAIPAASTNITTLIALVASELTLYAAHNTDAVLASGWAYHNAQNVAGHALASAVAPTTLAECMARLADIKAKYNAHEIETDCHTTGTVAADQIAMGLETYSVTTSDYIVGVTDTTADGTTNVILTTASCVAGRTFIVKDESLACNTNNFSVTTEGSELIDGAASRVFDANGQCETYYADGTNWFVINNNLA